MATPAGPAPCGRSAQLMLSRYPSSNPACAIGWIVARRVLCQIPDPGHSHAAVLDQHFADGLYQLDLLCGANERFVAAIDGSQGAVGRPELFLDAHALRDFGQQPFFRGLVELQGNVSSCRRQVAVPRD